MTTEERLDKLSVIVDALAATVVQHDEQIEATSQNVLLLSQSLNKIADLVQNNAEAIIEFRKQSEELRKESAETQRLWQAYLKRLPPQ